MIYANKFFQIFCKQQINMFVGVPDSLLSELNKYLSNNNEVDYVVTANEGNAVGYAAGYYLSSEKIPVVFMQNSGIGNAINPILSLVEKNVYDIPMIFIIGWRGKPDELDAVQHVKQGQVTIPLLNMLGVETITINKELSEQEIIVIIDKAIIDVRKYNKRVAIIISKGVFLKKSELQMKEEKYSLSCRDALNIIHEKIDTSIVVTTTGMISREWFNIQEKVKGKQIKNIYNVGAMGHANQVALGIAKNIENKNVYCIDGDGAFLMHMGGVAYIAMSKCKNYKHILLNNGVHATVGGEYTAGFFANLSNVALDCGYKKVFTAETKEEVEKTIEIMEDSEGPTLLEIKINKKIDNDVPRISMSTLSIKEKFMQY